MYTHAFYILNFIVKAERRWYRFPHEFCMYLLLCTVCVCKKVCLCKWKRSVREGLPRESTTELIAGHQMTITSRGRSPVTDTFGMVWEKNKCCKTRPYLDNIIIAKQSQDVPSGIPNFWRYFVLNTLRAILQSKTVWPKGPTAVRERVNDFLEKNLIVEPLLGIPSGRVFEEGLDNTV